jgi:hypothetical protein
MPPCGTGTRQQDWIQVMIETGFLRPGLSAGRRRKPGNSVAALVLALCGVLFMASAARADNAKPKYLRDLERPYNAGDWTLQCDSSRLCQIIGVVKPPKSGQGLRAVVMIRRGIAPGASPTLRIAFIDPIGFLGGEQSTETWRLYSRGLAKMPPPLRLGLGSIEGDGGYRAEPAQSQRLLGALQRWPGSVISDRGRTIARMPRGNLARLLRKMDRLQHPAKPQLTAEEEASWLKEYHCVVQRSAPADMAVPDIVLLSCDSRTYVNDPRGVRFGTSHYLWTASCPEGSKVFLQQEGQDPVVFDVRDEQGKIRPHDHAEFNAASLLELTLPRKGNALCGRHLIFGFSAGSFVMIEDRRYDRCRMVPPAFWPVVWSPTSWRYADASL